MYIYCTFITSELFKLAMHQLGITADIKTDVHDSVEHETSLDSALRESDCHIFTPTLLTDDLLPLLGDAVTFPRCRFKTQRMFTEKT